MVRSIYVTENLFFTKKLSRTKQIFENLRMKVQGSLTSHCFILNKERSKRFPFGNVCNETCVKELAWSVSFYSGLPLFTLTNLIILLVYLSDPHFIDRNHPHPSAVAGPIS